MSEYKVGITFNAKTGQFKSEVKQVESSIAKIGTTAQATNAKTNQLNSGVNRFGTTAVTSAGKTRQFNAELAATNKHAHGAHGSLGEMIKSMAIMSAVMGTVGLGAKLVTDLATFQDLRTQLRSLSKSAVDYADKEGFLIDLAKEHHKELAGLASGYAGLTVMVKEGVITDDQARKMVAGLSNGASQTGASAENLKQIFYGLNQTLGQGTVQAQELNQVVEPMPGLLSKLAKAAGQETGSAFRKLVGEGKVTSEMFAKYMVKALQDYDGAAARTANNINAKFADISTAYLLLAKNLETPINNALLPVLHGLAGGLNTLGENADTVSNIVFGAFALSMAHATKAVSDKTAATLKGIVTTNQQIIAEKAATLQKLNTAKSEQTYALMVLKSTQAQKSATIGTAQYTTAAKLEQIARVNLNKTIQSSALAQKNYNAAVAKGTILTRTLNGAMGFLGGPAGIAMLAAWAVYSFATSADKAASKTELLAFNVKELNDSYKELTVKGLRAKILKVNAAIKAQSDKVKSLGAVITRENNSKKRYYDAELKRFIVIGGQNKASRDLVVQAEDDKEQATKKLNAELALQLKLQDQLRMLSGVKDTASILKPTSTKPTKKAPIQDKNTLNAFAQQRDALKQQIALLGKTTELAKAEYATTYGKYSKLLPAQKAELIALAKTIDYKNKSNAADVVANNQAKQLANSANSYGASLQRKISLSGQVTEVQRLNYEIENGSLQGINDKLKEQLLLKAQLADQAIADSDKQLPFWEQLKENIQQTSTNFDAMWGRSFNNFAQGIGDATSTAIIEGQSFGQTMKTIARSAVKEVISGLIQIGVKKLALSAIEKTIGTTSAGVAAATAAVTGTAMAASYAPAAAMASLASFGANSAPAMAGITATTTLAEGLALAGMAHDGIDNVPREGTWLLDKGERVVDSRTNQDLKQALNNGNVGGGSNIVINYSPTLAPNTPEEFAQQLQEHSDHLYNLLSEAKADRGEDF